MTRIETRKEWGARASRGSSRLARTRGVKAHYTGGKVVTGTLQPGKHTACRAAVRGIQNGHMNGNGWVDIGYSMIVCDHDVAMIGRGPHVLPAANGPGLNSGHYAILVLVGTSGSTKITDNMKRAFHGARDYLMSHGAAGREIKGHQDGYATDCPGRSVTAWYRAGAKLPDDVPPVIPPTPEPEDSMDYGSFGYSGTPAIPIPPGRWIDVPWDTEFSDPYGSHAGSGETVLLGEPTEYTLEFGATLSGLPAGTVVYVRTAEFKFDDTVTPPVDVLEEAGDETPNVVQASGKIHHNGVGHVQDGRKLRIQVMSPVVAVLTRARARYLAQR